MFYVCYDKKNIMDKEELKAFLVEVEDDGIALLHSRGYEWFKSEFLPYLNLGDTLLADQVELLADCWYIAGDVYDFNGTPIKAIETYKKALEYDDEVDGAYREIANMYEQIGQYTQALEYINVAIEKMPDEEELMDERAAIQDSINYTVEPYLTKENKAWTLSEDLAEGKSEAVIASIATMENPTAAVLQCLAKAYGMEKKEEEYLQTWQQILKTEGALTLNYADWFYMPRAIYNSEKTWSLIKELSPRVEEAIFVEFDSLNEHYAEVLSQEEELNLICDFHMYRLTENRTALEQLATKYPLWEDVQDLLA
jgi:tetratricopeptide (TPR) repeat protein